MTLVLNRPFPLFALAMCCVLALAPEPAHSADTQVEAPPPTAAQTQELGAPVPVRRSDEQPANRIMVGEIDVIDLQVGFGSLSTRERARFVSERLLTLARSDASLAGLQLNKEPDAYKIVIDDNVLMVITAADAQAAHKDMETLAHLTFDATVRALHKYRDSRSLKSILIGIGLTVASFLGLIVAIFLIKRGFSKLDAELHRLTPRMGGGLHIKNVQILSAARIEGILRSLLRGLRLVLMLLCLYFFIPLILSFFAVTHAIGVKIFNLFVTPIETLAASFIAYIPNFFYILVICLVAYYTLKVLRYGFDLVDSGDLKLDFFYQEWAKPTYQIVRTLVIVMAAISAFPYIPGSGSAAFQGVGLVLGLVVSFASSSAISNVIAGVILVYTRAFKLGDRITVGDTTGDVLEKTLLVTRVKTPKNVVVTIPNSLVLNSHIVNFSSTRLDKDSPLVIHSTVTIGYDVPWEQVHRLLKEAALRTDGLEAHPAPFVLQTALNDFYVAYEINAHTRVPLQMPRLYSDLHRHIQDTFNEAGVEIMSPHYQALRDGNASSVPSVLAQPGYAPPRFAVDSAPAAAARPANPDPS